MNYFVECFSFAKNKTYKGTLVLPYWVKDKKVVPAFSKNLYAFPEVEAVLKLGDFQAKEGEIALLYPEKKQVERVLLLGLGDSGKISLESLRRSYGALEKFCKPKKLFHLFIERIHTSLFKKEEAVRAMLEGFLLSAYQFSLKSKNEKKDIHLNFLNSQDEKNAIEETLLILKAVTFARDLSNDNADKVTPTFLADQARQLAKKGLKVSILGRKEIEKEKMNLFLAVSRGSKEEPKLIIGEYYGNPKSKDVTAIVGKGVTFDTGGLNLKSTGSIEAQKADMSGGAAALAALKAAFDLKLKINLIVAVPSAENAIDAKSYKPGDVYESLSKKTVEITNTDAEGRLLLADTFTYLKENYPISRIIDLATLTGAIIATFGHEVSGLMSNDDALSERLSKAGNATYERVWRLPLFEEWREFLKSDIADMTSTGGPFARSITAALFLREFIGNTPWAHLDIAGTAYLPKAQRYYGKGATGVGVRLLIEFLKNLTNSKK